MRQQEDATYAILRSAAIIPSPLQVVEELILNSKSDAPLFHPTLLTLPGLDAGITRRSQPRSEARFLTQGRVEATAIDCRLNLGAWSVEVRDNGSGIRRQDLELIGQRYCTR